MQSILFSSKINCVWLRGEKKSSAKRVLGKQMKSEAQSRCTDRAASQNQRVLVNTLRHCFDFQSAKIKTKRARTRARLSCAGLSGRCLATCIQSLHTGPALGASNVPSSKQSGLCRTCPEKTEKSLLCWKHPFRKKSYSENRIMFGGKISPTHDFWRDAGCRWLPGESQSGPCNQFDEAGKSARRFINSPLGVDRRQRRGLRGSGAGYQHGIRSDIPGTQESQGRQLAAPGQRFGTHTLPAELPSKNTPKSFSRLGLYNCISISSKTGCLGAFHL